MKRISRRTFAAQAAGVFGAAALTGFGQTGKANTTTNGVLSDEFVERLPLLMQWANVPGVAVAVISDGKLAWSKGFGVKKYGEPGAVESSTLFGAASLSKPVFTYAVLRLRDEKLIDLDRPLWNYLPNADLPDAEQSKQITARHVLSHSSGLQNWRFQKTDKLEFAFKPGERFGYSGEGFYYLQRVLENITGRGFEEYMRERVLNLLGMTSSTYLWIPENESRVAWGHNGRMVPSEMFNSQQGKKMIALAAEWKKPVETWKYDDVAKAHAVFNKDLSPFPNFFLPNTAGSLVTTVDEYAKFMIRLMDGKKDDLDLSQASRTEMLSPQTKINDALAWGVGVGLEKLKGQNLFWHWGDNGTYKAFMMGDPAKRSGVVVFTNGSNGHKMWRTVVAEATSADHPAFYFYMV
jgi:CubicO group peptidase (beta-lactamase class C family)